MTQGEDLARGISWRPAILGYVAIALVVCFFRLGSTGAIHNEGIIADGARHMARTGDLLVPHLYNEPYTYKPPLTSWLVWSSFELTGRENTWTMRSPFALLGLLMGLTVLAGVGKACNPRLGLICALATLTCGLSLEKIRIAEYDLPLAAGVGVAVVAATTNFVSARNRTLIWLLCYAALTFAFLAKGTPALMTFFPGLVVAAWLTGRLPELASARHLAGLAFFGLAVGLYLWLVASSGHPAVFDQPLAEASERGFQWDWGSLRTTALKPFAAFTAFLPWSVFLPIAVLGLRRATDDDPATRLVRSGLGFAGGGLLAFLIVPTYELRYFYPLVVPVGIVCGLVAGDGIRTSRALQSAGRRAAFLLSWLSALATLVVGIGLLDGADRLIVVFIAGSAAALLAKPARMSTAWIALLGALCLWAAYVFVHFPRRAEKRSFERAAAQLAPLIPERSWLWIPPSADDEESLLLFHLNRPATRLREGQLAPLPGSWALLSPEHLQNLESAAGLQWVEIARGANQRREYILSRLELEACTANRAVFEQRADDLHAALLGRSPTPVEREELTSRLTAGMPLDEISRELTESVEFGESRRLSSDEEIVGRVYREILGRDPDRDGAALTVGSLRRGKLHVRVAGMLMSDEYREKHPYCSDPSTRAPSDPT